MQVICGWCDQTIASDGAGPRSHGLCLSCLPGVLELSVESIRDMTPSQRNILPYGFIRLDHDDVVLEYNLAESRLARMDAASVVGRPFFTEIAPCTNVKELAGWIRETRVRGKADKKSLRFVFEFAFGRELVLLLLSYDPASRCTDIVVKSESEEGLLPA